MTIKMVQCTGGLSITFMPKIDVNRSSFDFGDVFHLLGPMTSQHQWLQSSVWKLDSHIYNVFITIINALLVKQNGRH